MRQIKSLHVEFVPDRFTRDTLRPVVPRLDSQGPNSLDIVGGGVDSRQTSGKERRHQIPGLKTTPYLKVYILRCDDKETYKRGERQRVKEWIRDNVSVAGKAERHDAYEWLIIHVVIPDTIAASEPRWREASSKDSDELKERPKGSNAKWPGKPPRTVFDRLRADFNESKSTPDRIAQIRLLKSQVPPDLLPTPAVAATLAESPDERERAWGDLITKFKTLILSPLDARVREYEDNIAEQESRRSFPGWNFCTFFIHKEGLAKALESVGLVEDALAIYDELSLDLETVLRDIASGKADGTATSFSPSTADIKDRLIGERRPITNGAHRSELDAAFQRLFEKDYRVEIVTSRISVFDFFCYLFSRQKALILRLAGSSSARTEFGSKEGGEDLVLLAEVCWRALSFVHNGARTLRQDLSGSRAKFTPSDVEALVCSWSYLAAEFVLHETESAHLDPPQASNKVTSKVPNGGPEGSRRSDFGFGMGADPYPQRASSLPFRKRLSTAPELSTSSVAAPAEKINEEKLFSPPSSSGVDLARPIEVPGLAELSAYRAELVVQERRKLEVLAAKKGWIAGWASLNEAEEHEMQDVGLDDEAEASADSVDDGAEEKSEQQSSDLVSAQLAPMLETSDAFVAAFEALTNTAIRHFLTATHTKSAEKLTGDMAVLKYKQGDFAAASSFFAHVLPTYGTDGWSDMEAQALSLNVRCLQELGHKEELAKTALELLAKVAKRRMIRERPGLNTAPAFRDDFFDARGCLKRLIGLSEGLAADVSAPMVKYFADIELDHEIRLLDDRDGFAYRFRFRHVLEDDIELDEVAVRLVSARDPNVDFWLKASRPVVLETGKVDVELESTVSTFGPYHVDNIVMKAKKLHFQHELRPRPERDALGITHPPALELGGDGEKRPSLLLYRAVEAFDVRVELARDIDIGKPRHLLVTVESGWNDVEKFDLRLRPASAGLGLHLTEAKSSGVELRGREDGKSGVIALGGLAARSSATVQVRYTVDQAAPELAVRLEVQYWTVNGSFCHLGAVRLPTQLPLDVDVNDTFHYDALFSTFTVRTTNGMPLTLGDVELRDSEAYMVEAPPVIEASIAVFDQQPVSLAYKITRKDSTSGGVTKPQAALVMALDYIPADEMILSSLKSSFEGDLSRSDFRSLARLLLPLLAERWRSTCSRTDAEMAVLLHEAKVPSFTDLGWSEVIDTLHTAIQRPLSEWLLRWHAEHQRIELDGKDLAETARRSITITVDVPNVDVVFGARLVLQDAEGPLGHASRILNLGGPVEAELRFRHTRSWSASAVLGARAPVKSSKTKPQPEEFVFDIQNEPEIWLVGGPRRRRFTVREDDGGFAVKLVLIPLSPGRHALPLVDVQPASSNAEDRGIGGGGDGGKDVSCETNYESAGEVMQVIPDRRTTRLDVIEGSDAAAVSSLPSSRPSSSRTEGHNGHG